MNLVPSPVGQQYTDLQGVFWTVENVIQTPNLPEFFLVRISVSTDVDGSEQLVLAPSEFDALIRSRKLHPIGPDVITVTIHSLSAAPQPTHSQPSAAAGGQSKAEGG